jgi:predicted DNA binding CopG/RHH family protein
MAKNKTKKALQIHSEESLAMGRSLSATEISRFVEDFRSLHSLVGAKTKLISLKVPEPLLRAFRLKAEAQGLRYQTQIKKLMEEWLKE